MPDGGRKPTEMLSRARPEVMELASLLSLLAAPSNAPNHIRPPSGPNRWDTSRQPTSTEHDNDRSAICSSTEPFDAAAETEFACKADMDGNAGVVSTPTTLPKWTSLTDRYIAAQRFRKKDPRVAFCLRGCDSLKKVIEEGKGDCDACSSKFDGSHGYHKCSQCNLWLCAACHERLFVDADRDSDG